MAEKANSVDGFVFQDPFVAIDAKKEQEAINYIKQQIDMNQPANVLAVYKQLIVQDLFHTQVGYNFLKQLQNYLYSSPVINPADIPNIPVSVISKSAREQAKQETRDQESLRQEKLRRKKEDESLRVRGKWNYVSLFRGMRTICIVLIIAIIAMFYISSTSDSPTIVDYKEKITNEYAQWDQELTEKDRQLKEREAELVKKEAQQVQAESIANETQEEETETSANDASEDPTEQDFEN